MVARPPKWVGSFLVALSFVHCAMTKEAAAQRLEIDSVRLSVASSPFYSVRGTTHGATSRAQMRLAYLDRPLSIVVASPEAEGSRSHVVGGAFTGEIALSQSWANGLDLGVDAGAHVHQFGSGMLLADGNSELPLFGALDPLLEAGWSFHVDKVDVRPFLASYLPLGSSDALAGERKVRFETGVSSHQVLWKFEFAEEVSFLYRSTVHISTLDWKSQIKCALAAHYRISDFGFGPELLLRPVVGKAGSDGTTIIPALVVLGGRYDLPGVTLRAHYGFGLPLSHVAPDISKQSYFRAPTTPVQQFSLTVEFYLDVLQQR